jgi:hypothetical protein
MKREARLQSAKTWIHTYTGNNLVRGYSNWYKVDLLCAAHELSMLGIKVRPAYVEALKRDAERRRLEGEARSRAKRDQEITEATPSGFAFGINWDEQWELEKQKYYYIAGEGSDGEPFGVTWGEFLHASRKEPRHPPYQPSRSEETDVLHTLFEERLWFPEERAMERAALQAYTLREVFVMAKVKLSAIIDRMDVFQEGECSYISLRTGEVVTVMEGEFRKAEELEEEVDLEELDDGVRNALDILEHGEDYAELPDRYEIDEYGIMESFCVSRPSHEQTEQLMNVIGGKGSFRRFKETAGQLGLLDEWYVYRSESLREMAIEWCENNGLEYEE